VKGARATLGVSAIDKICSGTRRLESANVTAQRFGGHDPRWTLSDTKNFRTTKTRRNGKQLPAESAAAVR
jgi:hypothetical protein